MTKTYTPLIIEGKIYVVVDAPDYHNYIDPFDNWIQQEDRDRYYTDLATCTKYETLPEHAPYWKERIGQRVEVVIGQFFKWNDGNYMNTCAVCSERFMHGAKRQPVCKPCCETTYAIPPQQKQGDEYSWDLAWHRYKRETPNEQRSFKSLLDYLENNFNLTKK